MTTPGNWYYYLLAGLCLVDAIVGVFGAVLFLSRAVMGYWE